MMRPVTIPAQNVTTWSWIALILVTPWAQVASASLRLLSMLLLALVIGLGVLRTVWISGSNLRNGTHFFVALCLAVYVTSGMTGSLITQTNVDVEYVVQVLALALMIALWPTASLSLNSLRRIVRFGTLAVLAISATSIWLHLVEGAARAKWLYAGSNQLAGVLLVMSFFPFAALLMNEESLREWVTLVTTGVAIVLTSSRSAILLMIIATTVLVILREFRLTGRIRKAFVLAMALFSLPVVAVLSSELGVSGLDQLADKPLETSGWLGRLKIWREFWPKIAENPVFGHGLGDYELLLDSGPAHPHNLYVYLLYRSGLVGICVFTFAIVGIYGSLIMKLSRSDGSLRGFYTAVLTMTSILLVRETVEISILGNNASVTLLFWEMIVLAFSIEKECGSLDGESVA